MAKKYEPKGSLSLRSNHMDYGRETFVSNWHEAREAEPKDHEIDCRKDAISKNRSLHQSTYNRILDITDGKFPLSTTSKDHMKEVLMNKDFDERVSRHPMINISTFHNIDKTRLVNAPERDFGSILPRHPDHHFKRRVLQVLDMLKNRRRSEKRYLDSTYSVDYKAIHPYEQNMEETSTETDTALAHKKCHSQFTDVDDYRRHGRNTWHDELGTYASSDEKREVSKLTHTIT